MEQGRPACRTREEGAVGRRNPGKSEELGEKATLEDGMYLGPFQAFPLDCEGLEGRVDLTLVRGPSLRVGSGQCLLNDCKDGSPFSLLSSFSRFRERGSSEGTGEREGDLVFWAMV